MVVIKAPRPGSRLPDGAAGAWGRAGCTSPWERNPDMVEIGCADPGLGEAAPLATRSCPLKCGRWGGDQGRVSRIRGCRRGGDEPGVERGHLPRLHVHHFRLRPARAQQRLSLR